MKLLDLCSGIGGFSLACRQAGGTTIGLSEIDPYASYELNRNFPGIPNHGDLRKLCRRAYDCEPAGTDEVWYPRCEEEFGECNCIGTDQFTDTYGFPDVISAGVPCQPASLVGKRGGSEDIRWLWPEVLRIVGELFPRFAIFENPAALRTLEEGEAFRRILRTLAKIGYVCWWDVLPASAFGAGHRRSRLILVAADPDCQRLERHTGNGEVSREEGQAGYTPSQNLLLGRVTSEKWYRESGIKPVVDGLPGWMVKQQSTAIGNAVVPQLLLPYFLTFKSCLSKDSE